MMFGASKTALGIDISESRISLVLLRKVKGGVEFVRSASSPVPAGAVENGNIKDASILSRAVRGLKNRNKMNVSRTAVSLFARPVLVQIMDMPKQVPTNISQFVQNEIKNYVVLPGKDIALDFCGIDSRGRSDTSRVFVVAVNGQKVSELARVCNQAGVNNIEAIEPPVLAYARAFYRKKIAGKFDCNVLMVIQDGDVLTLCVFRNQSLDFVRTKNIGKEKDEPAKLTRKLAEEINTIVKFYDVEVPDNCGKWEITVICDQSARLPDDAEKLLKAVVANSTLRIQTAQNAYRDTAVGDSQYIKDEKPSTVAIGLAMKLLGAEGGMKINLIPEETSEVKCTRKDALIAANIAAVILVLMVLVVGGLISMTGKINERISRKKQTQLSRNTTTLLKEEEQLEARIKQMSDRPGWLNSISNLHHKADWPGALNDIRNGTPKASRITKLLIKDDLRLSLEGQALSYESVHLFINMLNKSEHIDSAALIETEKDEDDGGVVRYSISCSLVPEKRKADGVN